MVFRERVIGVTLPLKTKTVSVALARSWRRRFETSAAPTVFVSLVNALSEAAGDEVITSPSLGFWRDAFVAGQFATALAADWVRLVAAPALRPDFLVSVEGVIRSYEVTEADRPSRRRNDEFKAAALMEAKFWEDHVDTPDEVEGILRTAATRKADKAAIYEQGCGLIIYLTSGASCLKMSAIHCFVRLLDQREARSQKFGF